MEYFLELFGSLSISWVIMVLGAGFFLWQCYRKVEKYFTEKAIADKEKDEQIQQVINQAKKYPEWHQQSLDIQKKFTDAITELRNGQAEQKKKLDAIELANRKQKRNELRESLLQSYRYFTNIKKNPMQAWSEMESEAFWDLFSSYEDVDGDGHVHTVVQPEMRKLEVIPMFEVERITELMNSRK